MYHVWKLERGENNPEIKKDDVVAE
jgi:hypothetical protein